MTIDRQSFMERLASVPGASLGEGAFSPGPAIWAGRREVAHFDSDGALDVRLTKAAIRQRRPELKANPRVTLRANSSDWIEFDLTDGDAGDEAVALVQAALAANLPTAEPGPQPTGTDLERRRRFR